MTANPDSGMFAKDPLQPIGGNIMAHASCTRCVEFLVKTSKIASYVDC